MHPGLLAEMETQTSVFTPLDEKKADLLLSAEERDDTSSKQFGVVDVTLENRTDDFITIDVVDLHFEEAAESGTTIPLGAELAAWIEGSSNELALNAVNRGWARALLAGAGAVTVIAGAAANKPAVVDAGGAAIATAETMANIEQLEQINPAVEQAGLFPHRHLLAGPITIAPGQFVRRWLVVFTKDPDQTPFVERFFISANVAVGQSPPGMRRYALPFRELLKSTSHWQRRAAKRARRKAYPGNSQF